jgi:predicted ArsR family transcriptional regulator
MKKKEIDKDFHHFLTYWFSGLMKGLEELDDSSRNKILRECGKSCSQSYTAQIFREAKENSSDIDSMLKNLAKRFPGSTYERKGSNIIEVTYDKCGCDLVRLGLVKSPNWCQCSAFSLQENFQQVLGVPVSVEIQASILNGAKQCILIISTKDNI